MDATLKEILTLADVKVLVDSFYGKIREDNLLSGIFNERIQDRWPEHLEKMYTFWQTVLLGEHTYYGAPFMPHANLEVYHEHFERWLALWYQTLDEHFTGKNAEEAKWRSARMAEMFEYKINYRRENENFIPLV